MNKQEKREEQQLALNKQQQKRKKKQTNTKRSPHISYFGQLYYGRYSNRYPSTMNLSIACVSQAGCIGFHARRIMIKL